MGVKVFDGSIVQITDENHPWFPCLMIVTEVKSWGVQGCVLIPQSNQENKVVQAYNRIKDDQFEVVGNAVYVPEK